MSKSLSDIGETTGMESYLEVSEGAGVETRFVELEEDIFLEDFERKEDVDFCFILGVEGDGLKARV